MKKILTITFISLFAINTLSAQKKAVPIAEMGVGGLLGGVENGRWIAADKMAAKMRDQTEFILVGWKGVEEGGVSTATKELSQDVCQDFIGMKFDLETETGIALGSDAKWKPVP